MFKLLVDREEYLLDLLLYFPHATPSREGEESKSKEGKQKKHQHHEESDSCKDIFKIPTMMT